MLRVDSPGGSVFGSELVRRELELTRAAGKPVVVSMGNVAASGGYWISTASDEIIADAGHRSPARSACSRCCRPPTRRSTSSASTPPASPPPGCAAPTTRACRSTRASADADPEQRRPHLPRVHRQGRAGAQDHAATRSTRSRRAASGPARRRKERGLVDTARQLRRRARARRRRAPSSATTTAHRLHRARAGRVRALRRACSTPRWRAPSARAIDAEHRRASACRAACWRAARARPRLGSPSLAERSKRRSTPSSTASAAGRLKAPAGRRRAAAVAQPRAARSGPPPARPVPGAGRRRLGQDARDHAQDRAPARRPATQPSADRRDHLHQQGRARDARARARRWSARAPRRTLAICTFHALGVRILRRTARALGLKPQFSHPRQRRRARHPEGRRRHAPTPRTARRWQWTISLWKNQGLNAAQAEAAGARTTTSASRRASWSATRSASRPTRRSTSTT